MFRKLKLVAQLLFLQFTARSQSLPFDKLPFTNPLQTETDSVLHTQTEIFFKKAKAPGLIIGISRDSKTDFYSYGFCDPASGKVFTPKTIFEAGSVTKTFTANLLFQLKASGIIDLQKPVTAYLPDSIGNNPVLSKISLSDLASHKSGLPRVPPGYDKSPGYSFMQPYRSYKREQLYPFLQKLKPLRPGKYDYSNLGFGLLSTVFENQTGKSFESLLAEYIWTPLGMKSSYVNNSSLHTDTATGHFYGKPAAYWDFDCLAGCGAIKTNAEDLLKYLEAHMHRAPENFANAASNVLQPMGYAGPEMQICYGWHTLDAIKHRVYWHNGGTYGFSTFAAFEPVTKTAIVLVSNASSVNAALDKLSIDLLIWLTGKK